MSVTLSWLAATASLSSRASSPSARGGRGPSGRVWPRGVCAISAKKPASPSKLAPGKPTSWNVAATSRISAIQRWAFAGIAGAEPIAARSGVGRCVCSAASSSPATPKRSAAMSSSPVRPAIPLLQRAKAHLERGGLTDGARDLLKSQAELRERPTRRRGFTRDDEGRARVQARRRAEDTAVDEARARGREDGLGAPRCRRRDSVEVDEHRASSGPSAAAATCSATSSAAPGTTIESTRSARATSASTSPTSSRPPARANPRPRAAIGEGDEHRRASREEDAADVMAHVAGVEDANGERRAGHARNTVARAMISPAAIDEAIAATSALPARSSAAERGWGRSEVLPRHELPGVVADEARAEHRHLQAGILHPQAHPRSAAERHPREAGLFVLGPARPEPLGIEAVGIHEVGRAPVRGVDAIKHRPPRRDAVAADLAVGGGFAEAAAHGGMNRSTSLMT